MNKITDFSQVDIGFLWKGLVVFLLPLLPNALFFILKDPNGRAAITNNLIKGVLYEKVTDPLVWIVGYRQSIVLCGSSNHFARRLYRV